MGILGNRKSCIFSKDLKEIVRVRSVPAVRRERGEMCALGSYMRLAYQLITDNGALYALPCWIAGCDREEIDVASMWQNIHNALIYLSV
jgi:hypothetical protein